MMSERNQLTEAQEELLDILAEEAAEFVRKHPLPSVFGALAAGFLLGAFFNRK